MSAQSDTQNTKVGIEQGGDRMFLKDGAAFEVNDVDIAPFLAAMAALGKVVRFGTATLDGSGATPVATGLTAVEGGIAAIKKATSPGVGTSVLTVNPNGANLDVYPWKVTATGDATLIASTGTEDIYWLAWGT